MNNWTNKKELKMLKCNISLETLGVKSNFIKNASPHNCYFTRYVIYMYNTFDIHIIINVEHTCVKKESNVKMSRWNSKTVCESCRKLGNWKISLRCCFKSDIELKKIMKKWKPSTYFPFLEPIPHLWILPGKEIVKLTLWTSSISKLR